MEFDQDGDGLLTYGEFSTMLQTLKDKQAGNLKERLNGYNGQAVIAILVFAFSLELNSGLEINSKSMLACSMFYVMASLLSMYTVIILSYQVVCCSWFLAQADLLANRLVWCTLSSRSLHC